MVLYNKLCPLSMINPSRVRSICVTNWRCRGKHYDTLWERSIKVHIHICTCSTSYYNTPPTGVYKYFNFYFLYYYFYFNLYFFYYHFYYNFYFFYYFHFLLYCLYYHFYLYLCILLLQLQLILQFLLLLPLGLLQLLHLQLLLQLLLHLLLLIIKLLCYFFCYNFHFFNYYLYYKFNLFYYSLYYYCIYYLYYYLYLYLYYNLYFFHSFPISKSIRITAHCNRLNFSKIFSTVVTCAARRRFVCYLRPINATTDDVNLNEALCSAPLHLPYPTAFTLKLKFIWIYNILFQFKFKSANICHEHWTSTDMCHAHVPIANLPFHPATTPVIGAR